MNTIKKYAGILWMMLGAAGIWYLFKTAAAEITRKPLIDTKIQWAVFVIIFIPIALGMILFGYYAWKGEYDENVKM